MFTRPGSRRSDGREYPRDPDHGDPTAVNVHATWITAIRQP
ncbi:MAG TPA: hypothetical protein PLD25_07090 [Chloroflexota bacterium]|nr:hypothetical protein [Chloroflexota bacterium]